MRITHRLIFVLSAIILLNGCVSTHNKELKAGNFFIFKTKKSESSYIKSYNKALFLWPIPYEELDVKTSYGTAHVIVSGPAGGEPLVLLHGMNASSTMWYPNINAFAEKYRVYAIDFILEPGKSISKGKIKSKEEILLWYNEVFNQLKLENFSIVGASRGGWLTLHLATNTKIKSIVLLSPAQSFKYINPKRDMLSNMFFFMFPKRERLRKSLETFSSDVDNIKQPFIDQYYIASRKAKKNSSLLQMRPFSDKELKSITIPVLLLIGDADIINNNKSIERVQNLMSNAEGSIIPHAGHFLSFDQPEMVNKKIMDFLSRCK